MGHRAQRRDAVFFSGIGRGRSSHSADVSGTGAEISRIEIMRAAGAEFHDRPAVSCLHDAPCLGRDQRLMVHAQQHRRLQQLRVDDLRLYPDQRLIREHRGAFRDRIQIAGKVKMTQVIEEFLREFVQRAQIIDVLLFKMKVLDIADHFLQAGADAVASAIGIAAVKHVEDDFLLLVAVEVALAHRQFIEVHDQAQIALVTKIKFVIITFHFLTPEWKTAREFHFLSCSLWQRHCTPMRHARPRCDKYRHSPAGRSPACLYDCAH